MVLDLDMPIRNGLLCEYGTFVATLLSHIQDRPDASRLEETGVGHEMRVVSIVAPQLGADVHVGRHQGEAVPTELSGFGRKANRPRARRLRGWGSIQGAAGLRWAVFRSPPPGLLGVTAQASDES